jgi:hypothetical protein
MNQVYEVKIGELNATVKMQEKQIAEFKAQISELQKNQQQAVLAAVVKPHTSVKNTIKNLQINNLQPITDESLRASLPHLTYDHIRAGAEGYAKYALEYPLKGKLIVADAARKKITWRDESGSLVSDAEGTELSKKFFAVVKDPSLKAIRELMNELNERHDMAQDAQDEVEIARCDAMLCRLDDIRREIRQTIGGTDTGLRSDFVKHICVSTPELVPGISQLSLLGVHEEPSYSEK